MKHIKIAVLNLGIAAFLAAGLISCERDSESVVPETPGAFDNGVFVCNEGPFQSGTGTVSFISRSTGIIYNELFKTSNNLPLGNIVQSMTIFKGKAYIIVNNANRVEIVDIKTFKSVGFIEGLTLPRFFIGIAEGKAYVSCWDNKVAVLDLSSNTISARINVGTGPERMLKTGNLVFVANQGGFSIDSTITVIDALTNKFLSTLPVFSKPTGMVTDKNGKLWVLCSGKGFNGWPQPGDSEGHLLRINPADLSIEKNITFPDNSNHPDKLAINESGDVLYYIYKEGVYSFQIESETLRTSALISRSGYCYALDYDITAKCIYLSDPLDYVQNGWVFRYNPLTGKVIDSLKAGIIPTFFTFN